MPIWISIYIAVLLLGVAGVLLIHTPLNATMAATATAVSFCSGFFAAMAFRDWYMMYVVFSDDDDFDDDDNNDKPTPA